MAFAQDGKTIMFVSIDGSAEEHSLQVWNIRKGEKVCEYTWPELSTVRSLAFSPDGRFLISGYSSGQAQIRDARQCSSVLFQIECDLPIVDMVAVSAKNVIATAWSREWPIQLWDINSGLLLSTLYVDEDAPPPSQLEFSSDGGLLRTAAGAFDLSGGFSSSEDVSAFQPQLLRLNRAGDWVQRNGEDLIWLPFEFRAESDYIDQGASLAIRGEKIAIATPTRGVVFFHLK
jgi:WD40 repeat protein